MQKNLLGLAFVLAAVPALAADPPPGPSSDRAAAAQAHAEADQQLAALCAKITCRKASRQIILRMRDGTSFQIGTQPLPYIDDKGMLIIFAGESITLSYAKDDALLEHPTLSAASDPGGAAVLPPVPGQTVNFNLRQLDGKPDMQLIVTNTTAATIKYDAVMFMPDPATGGARGGRTTACPVLPPQGAAPGFSGIESWQQPIVLLRITNIRALAAGSPRSCD